MEQCSEECSLNSKASCSLEEVGSGLCTSKLIVSQDRHRTCGNCQVKLGNKGTARSVCDMS